MRNYLPGDDVRSIDWKATARTGEPHVRVFTEERDRPALIVVDQRMSMYFGSVLNMKSVTAAEAAAIAAFRVLDAGDRVGGVVFDDERQLEFAPKRSQRAVYSMLEAVADMNSGLHADKPSNTQPGSLNNILRRVARVAHHDHLVLVLSDFDGIDESTHRHLSGIAAHNDLVLGLVYDPAARDGSIGERLILGDGKLQAEVDLSRSDTAQAIRRTTKGRLDRILDWQLSINLSVLPLSAGEDTLAQVREVMATLAPTRRVR